MRFIVINFFALVALASFVFANPEPAPAAVPEPGRARCGGKTSGFCPSGQSCVRSGRYYSCKAGG